MPEHKNVGSRTQLLSGRELHDPLEDQAARLQEYVVGVLSGTLLLPEGAKQVDESWRGVGGFAVNQFGIEGTFCVGSTLWVLGSGPVVDALDVLADTDEGLRELHLSLYESGEPNFRFGTP